MLTLLYQVYFIQNNQQNHSTQIQSNEASQQMLKLLYKLSQQHHMFSLIAQNRTFQISQKSQSTLPQANTNSGGSALNAAGAENDYKLISDYILGIMGNSIERKAQRIKRKIFSSEQQPPQAATIGFDFQCQNCKRKFPAKTLQTQLQAHVVACAKPHPNQMENQLSAERRPNKNQLLVPSKNQEVVLNYNIEDYYYIKEPLDDTYTRFKWQKAPLKLVGANTINMPPEEVRTLSFQQKSSWFRYHLQKLRIPWMAGADYMHIEKTNVLMSSLIHSKKVNMHKEVKIQFIGDKVNDAGGLLREWMHLVINEMFGEETGIFKLCKTDDTMYRLKWDQEIDEEFSAQLLILYGTILGKAIFEKIPVNSYLDRTILRQLASRQNEIQFCDIFGFDKQLYQNWKFILQNEINDMGLQTYFVISREGEDSTVDLVYLVEDGQNILVTDQNKKMYVNLSIATLCKQKVERSIDFIRKGLYKVIPQQLLQVFQPFQMEMLLYGVPYIDVKDWRTNTDYKGIYNPNHEVVRWFWEVMEAFDQEQLARMLKFSTGSSRTPIHGFKKLQSNRGNFSKFLIQSSDFHKHNPYPKGHTCFNRLELPKYPSKQQLKLYVSAIANSNNLDGIFGLD